MNKTTLALGLGIGSGLSAISLVVSPLEDGSTAFISGQIVGTLALFEGIGLGLSYLIFKFRTKKEVVKSGV